MNYQEAKAYYEAIHGGDFPFSYYYEQERFIRVKIVAYECYIKKVDPAKVDKYANNMLAGYVMPAVWAVYGKRAANGVITPFWHCKIDLFDGNHRAAAALKIGRRRISAIMPETDYRQYRQVNDL